MKNQPLTPESLRALLVEEVSRRFPSVEIGSIAISTADGSAQWLVEVKAPAKFFRVFHPDAIGQRARARIFAAEIEHWITERLATAERE